MDQSNSIALGLAWGLLAERHGLLAHEPLQIAVETWAQRPSESLGKVLTENGSLDANQFGLAQELVQYYLAGTQYDRGINFVELGLLESAATLLHQIINPEWKAVLWSAINRGGEVSTLTVTDSSGESQGTLASLLDRDSTQLFKRPPDPDLTATAMPEDHQHLDSKVSADLAYHPTLQDNDLSRADVVDIQTIADSVPGLIAEKEAEESVLKTTIADPGKTVSSTHLSMRDAAKKAIDPYATIADSTEAIPDVTQTYVPTSDTAGIAPPGAFLASRYQIVRHHARGGLGAVYLANDTELHREVALKEIHGQHADRSETRARFMLEAEVTGGLEHPGIVPVYGLGQYHDGRPYYAMKFISGDSLQDALKKFHEKDQTERDPGERALSLRRLMTQFVDVCEAIAYAHSRGVLHRDLKPGNIMIGKYGETLVVDWGLAKPLGRCFHHDLVEPTPVPVRRGSKVAIPSKLAESPTDLTLTFAGAPSVSTEPTQAASNHRPLIPSSVGMRSETLVGSTMGTPQYMSPEQARGEVDLLGPPSDIYSLGATLYCVLVGKAPFNDKHLFEMLTKVREGEFPRPSEANPKVTKPLEAIVLKAMALVPEDRYPSALVLAQDIEHWLADEPVSAYPDPWQVRLKRWMRRHKTFVTAASVLAVTGLSALMISTVLIERERRLVSANFGLAYDAADTMLSEVSDVDLADIPQMEPVRKKLLETARVKLTALLVQRSNDLVVQLLEGRTQARLGNVLDLIGDYSQAETIYRQAITSLTHLSSRRPSELGPKSALARAEHGLGVLLRKLNRFREAETALRSAMAHRVEIAAKTGDDPEDRQAVAETRYQLGVLLSRVAGRTGEDETLYREAIHDQEEALKQPQTAQDRLPRYLNNLAILENKSRPADAEKHFQEILNLLAKLDEPIRNLPGPRWQAARASNNLASLALEDRNRIDQAEKLLNQARTALETLAAEFPRIAQYRRELSAVDINLAIVERSKGRFAQAEPLARAAADLLRKLSTDEPQVPDHRRNMAVALNELAFILAGKDPAEAEKVFAESKATQEELIARYPEVPDYPNALGRSLYSYGKFLFDGGHTSQAKPWFVQAENQYRNALIGDPKNRLFTKNLYEARVHLMLVELKNGEIDAAAKVAVGLPEILPDEQSSYLDAAMGLAQCVLQLSGKSSDRAEAFGRQAVEMLQTAVDRHLLINFEPLRANEFVPLRTRTDFIELIKALRAKGTPRVG